MSTTTARRPGDSFLKSPLLGRFLACMALGFVLALMIGKQEGTQQDFGLAFRQAVLGPRIFAFLLIGFLVFLAITFWPYIQPLLIRPGVRPLVLGALTVVASLALLKWTDDPRVEGGKFGTLASAAGQTGQLAPVARLFYGNAMGWISFVVVAAVAAVAIMRQIRVLAWVGTALAVLVAFWAWFAHSMSKSFLGTPDHSTGALVAVMGYLAIAAACLTAALTRDQVADSHAFVQRVFAWRPGMPLVVVGALVGIAALAVATWFDPTGKNATLVDTASMFGGTGLAPLSKMFLSWLCYVLFVAALATAGYAAWSRNRMIGWVAAGLGLVGMVLTLVTLHAITALAASTGYAGATGPWQNLGTGGWMAALAFLLLTGAGYIVATLKTFDAVATRVGSDAVAGGARQAPGMSRAILFLVLGFALFYPPMANPYWQKVLVTQIGIYVLLAVGLNVVVGWAGLLDLGYIAFYALGSYTTAYLTGALPITPPGWLHMPPLLAIPFAILVCLIAGVALGAPTLRLRGDYLAIVTLGFGEIIRIFAINADSITNGPKGAFGIPQPAIHLGPLNIQWGQNPLQYWYLLLVIVILVVIAFNRLEQSSLGRAWAAIREDEVAAQATGVNTTRVKLLAFAIGASTSGIAGVFFASQIGYINPDNFVLNNSILVVAYVVFGGMGSLPGAMAGAAVLTWLPEFLKDQVPAEDRQMWIGAVILLMMIFRPGGLIPARRREIELEGFDDTPSSEPRAVPLSEGMITHQPEMPK